MGVGKNMILGILFLLIGLSILLKAVFHIDIPVVRTAFALFIIYIGFKMLLGGSWCSTGKCDWSDENSAVFNSRNFKWTEDSKGRKSYSVVFGSSTVDLTEIVNANEDTHVEINTVFGETKVLVSRNTPLAIGASAVFGEAKMPDDNMVAFGSLKFHGPPGAEPTGPKIVVRGHVVFGSLQFQFKD